MANTKIKMKKALACIAVAAIATGVNSSFAATQIGTGTVTGNAGLDTTIMWNDTFTAGSASGSVDGVIVTAKVDPILNMVISTDTIALGTLDTDTFTTQGLDIEIGTNAVNGVTVTARSGSGGLTHKNDDSIKINNAVVDGVAEDYKFLSIKNATHDSSITNYTHVGALDTQVNDNVAEHIVYQTTKPESKSVATDDVRFNVSAKINDQTPSGEYQDTITFTVTGNF
jgi:hypothetical protein